MTKADIINNLEVVLRGLIEREYSLDYSVAIAEAIEIIKRSKDAD